MQQVFSDRSRISQRGHQAQTGGTYLIFAENCMKMKKFGVRRGVHTHIGYPCRIRIPKFCAHRPIGDLVNTVTEGKNTHCLVPNFLITGTV